MDGELIVWPWSRGGEIKTYTPPRPQLERVRGILPSRKGDFVLVVFRERILSFDTKTKEFTHLLYHYLDLSRTAELRLTEDDKYVVAPIKYGAAKVYSIETR